jgi:hypothetical protein
MPERLDDLFFRLIERLSGNVTTATGFQYK